jgi:subtilisin-like proprotein convertase family protein
VGSIPDGGSGQPPKYGPARVVSFAVSGVSGPVSSIEANVTLTHTFVGQLDMVLTSPNGVSFVTMSRVGATTANGKGDNSNLGGTYTFTDASSANIWTVAGGLGQNATIAPGSYRTTGAGGAGQSNPAPFTNFTAAFAGLTTAQINGTWTLSIRDDNAGETGSVTAASLVIGGTVCQ